MCVCILKTLITVYQAFSKKLFGLRGSSFCSVTLSKKYFCKIRKHHAVILKITDSVIERYSQRFKDSTDNDVTGLYLSPTNQRVYSQVEHSLNDLLKMILKENKCSCGPSEKLGIHVSKKTKLSQSKMAKIWVLQILSKEVKSCLAR